MKAIKESFNKTVRIAKVEKEDLEYIEASLAKLAPNDLVIKIPGYEIASVNELDSIKEKFKISEIKYQMYKPEYVSIEINNRGMRMYTADADNVSVKGVFYDIEQRLKHGLQNMARLIGGILAYMGSITLFACIGVIVMNQITASEYYLDRAIATTVAAFGVTVLGMMLMWYGRFRFNPYEKVPNVFARRADELIISTWTVLTGGFITYLITFVVK